MNQIVRLIEAILHFKNPNELLNCKKFSSRERKILNAVISQEILTDNDAINHFSDQKFSSSAYRTFKSRLKDKLIHCLLLIESSQSTIQDQWKLFYLATVLVGFNLYDYANKILSDVVDFSEKYQVPDLGIMASKEKVNLYRHIEDYSSLNDAYIKLEEFRRKEQAEYKAELLSNKYRDFELRTLTKEMIYELILDIEELSELLYNNRSSKIFKVFHELKIYHFISESNFIGLLTFTKDLAHNYPDINLSPIKIINQYYVALSLFKCGKYIDCLDIIEDELQISDEDSPFYSKLLQTKISCYLHLNKIAQTYLLLDKVILDFTRSKSDIRIFQFYRLLLSFIFDAEPDKKEIHQFILENKDLTNLSIRNFELKSGVIMLSYLFSQRYYSSSYFTNLYEEYVVQGVNFFVLRKERYVNEIIKEMQNSSKIGISHESFTPFDFTPKNSMVNFHDGIIPYNLVFDFYLKESLNCDQQFSLSSLN